MLRASSRGCDSGLSQRGARSGSPNRELEGAAPAYTHNYGEASGGGERSPGALEQRKGDDGDESSGEGRGAGHGTRTGALIQAVSISHNILRAGSF
jgi:hypothetical protein